MSEDSYKGRGLKDFKKALKSNKRATHVSVEDQKGIMVRYEISDGELEFMEREKDPSEVFDDNYKFELR